MVIACVELFTVGRADVEGNPHGGADMRGAGRSFQAIAGAASA
jgi:hypothetical protein